MKIGLDAKRAFLNSSGLGNYSRNTLDALVKNYPKHKLLLFTPEIKSGLLKNQKHFEIIAPCKSWSKTRKSFWRTFKLSKDLTNKNLSLFHGLSNELPNGIHKINVPTLVTIHDLIFIRYPEFYRFIDRKIYANKVKYACKKANRIIAISQQTKQDIINFIGINSDKITVLHQSISPLFFEKAPIKETREKYKLPDKFILSVGTLEERKNQLSTLKAIVEKDIKTPLIFVGNASSYGNEIHKFIAEKGIEKQVFFLRNIPEKDLAALYQMASLSIYISVFEGFGLPVIESMACGCPVITSNASCLPETAGGAAELCTPNNIEKLGDTIQDILSNKDRRKSLVEKGKLRAEDFRPEKYAEKLVSLYTELSR